MLLTHIWQRLIFFCLIHTITRSKTLCSSLRHSSFQINQKMREGQEPKGENATHQLGANWSSIHYSLLLGKRGLRVGARGSYLIGGATTWSYEGLLSNFPRKGETLEFWKRNFLRYSLWLVWWIRSGGQNIYIYKYIYIYTHSTKTLRLTLKFNEIISIQL